MFISSLSIKISNQELSGFTGIASSWSLAPSTKSSDAPSTPRQETKHGPILLVINFSGGHISISHRKEENATSSGCPWPYKLERSIREMELLLKKFYYWFYLLCEEGRDTGGEDTNWHVIQASFHPPIWHRFCPLALAHTKTVWRAGKLVDSILEVEIADLIKFHQIKNQLHFCQAQGQRQTSKLEPEVRSVMGWSDDGQVVKWRSVESQVKVKSQSELDIGGRETCDY